MVENGKLCYYSDKKNYFWVIFSHKMHENSGKMAKNGHFQMIITMQLWDKFLMWS